MMLPFDHRAPFEQGLFGRTGVPARQQTEQMTAPRLPFDGHEHQHEHQEERP
jgi:hypothetical protein